MIFRHGSLSRRDAFLLLIGASSMHIWSMLFSTSMAPSDQSIVINTHLQHNDEVQEPFTLTKTAIVRETKTQVQTTTKTVTAVSTETAYPKSRAIFPTDDLPQTELLAHAPGWTLFRNLYMSNGTIFIVADQNGRKTFPEIRMMTSTGLEAENTPENIAMREPTDENMRIITPQEAKARWVGVAGDRKRKVENRVWSVEGNTVRGFFYYLFFPSVVGPLPFVVYSEPP